MAAFDALSVFSVAQESWVSALIVALLLAVFLWFGWLLSVKDIASHRLPNSLVARWLLASMIVLSVLSAVRMDFWPLLQAVLGMALLCGGYLLIALISAGAMGMGDVKLAAVLGLNLGYFSLPFLFVATVISFVLSSLFVLGGVLLRKLTLKSAVPFGPFMVIGALAALLMAR
ncbi:A24 family peptidase [Glutamicibacter sp.]|uniref:A24 family peptidase n=1 Tax=Glutamicibacter sp. TaxID=1931995 RepID=UPI0028BDD2ED|nr:A24 family peptidase [Glutamicibacter sp.]